MDLGLSGKVAIVTGGSRGIGRGIVEGLLAEGCKVVTCARNAEKLQQAVDELRASGDIVGVPLDITSRDAGETLLAKAKAEFGAVDVLVNNAGGNKRGAFVELSDEDWQTVLELNFNSHVRVARAVAGEMQKRKSGSIIFIASIFGREAGGKGLAIYNSTKSAMISMAKIMAMELAADNVRVNSVAPGSIRFPGGSWDRRCIEDPEGMQAFIDRELPLGRFGTVEEVANVVAFLASERASLVTGTCINVDGCQSRSLI
ncbi:MAG TPA: glucose 1-dehydrogenase [Bacteroidetes bacterium]|nr:glucose 1-dehydrogenase [Bacteroidota bacterium]